MSSSDIIQLLLSGIAMGGIYTLLAKGMFITYAANRALNFGQGDLLTLAAFMGMSAVLAGVPVFVAIIAVAIFIGCIGVGVERLVIRPLKSRGVHNVGWILTTMGVGMILQNFISIWWGKSRFTSPPLFSVGENKVIHIFGAGVYAEELIIAVVSLLIIGILYYFLYRTPWGRNLSVVTYNEETAALLGIDARRTVFISYMLMGILTAIAGLMVGPVTVVHSHMGFIFMIKAFAVLAVGGFANPLGILIVGFIFGIGEAFGNFYNSAFGDLYPFIAVFLVLIIKPTGLFGERMTDVR